jgi:hypothetical protein
MKHSALERAENSDLDSSLAILIMRYIFREKKFRKEDPFKYANLRTHLGKEIPTRWLSSTSMPDIDDWTINARTRQSAGTISP